MKPEIKKLWVDALRSEKYSQGEGKLHKGDSYCCLGVLCDLAVQSGVEVDVLAYPGDINPRWATITTYDGASEDLPRSVQRWAGLTDPNPEVPREDEDGDVEPTELADLNDAFKLDFNEIADLIEEHL